MNTNIEMKQLIDPEIQKAFDEGKIFVLDNGLKTRIEKIQMNSDHHWQIQKYKKGKTS